jgi:hypothetical protein
MTFLATPQQGCLLCENGLKACSSEHSKYQLPCIAIGVLASEIISLLKPSISRCFAFSHQAFPV